MRAFPVRLPSGARYWTVLDEDLAVVSVADGFLRQVRFGRDGAESTTKSYAHSIALFLRWCARTGLSGAKIRPVPVTCDDRQCAPVGHDGQPCPSACST
jgi:hypothetical protein